MRRIIHSHAASCLHGYSPVTGRCRGSAATVTLLGVLLLCVLSAAVLVWTRAGRREARERAVEIVEKVAADGLDHYYGTDKVVHYYLLMADDKVMGYSATMSQLTQGEQGSQGRLNGAECRYNAERESESRVFFEIANDLGRYSHSEVFKERGRSVVVQHRWSPGLVQIGDGRRSVTRAIGEQPNLIPLGLLDFFSGLALADGDEPAAFGVLLNRLDPKAPLMVEECTVRPGGDVPEGVRQQDARGRAASTTWLSGHEQVVYYDNKGQLLWQRDFRPVPGGQAVETLRMVTLDELLDSFPDAQSRLESWRATLKDDEDEDGATL